MITKHEAIQIATQYAADHGYVGVHLLEANFKYLGFMDAFAFNLLSEDKPGQRFNPVGPPLMLMVDKVGGHTIEDRVLVR